MSHLVDRISGAGYQVYVVPEAATLVINSGISPDKLTPEQFVAFQKAILRNQLALEEGILSIAQLSDRPSVILCDRGALDGKGYTSPEVWPEIISEYGSEIALRDERYDAVIHMVTAADGASEHYSLLNNPARYESTLERAIQVDRSVQRAWVGHPHLRIIRNEGDFERKIHDTMSAVCRVLGIPEPLEIERKYLVREVGAFPAHVHAVDVEIEQRYLRGSARVRRRGVGPDAVYTHTIKQSTGIAGKRIEIERKIGFREYSSLLADSDPLCGPITKTRKCFLWEGRYFELDTFQSPRPGLQLLEVELNSLDEKVDLPPWIAIDRDVTEEPAFANRELALLPIGRWL